MGTSAVFFEGSDDILFIKVKTKENGGQ